MTRRRKRGNSTDREKERDRETKREMDESSFLF